MVKVQEWGPKEGTYRSPKPRLSILTEPAASVYEIRIDGDYVYSYDRKKEKGVFILNLDRNKKSVTFIVKDEAGNTTEVDHQIQLRGLRDGSIIYDGKMGEDINDLFGNLIKIDVEEVKRRYGLDADLPIEITDYPLVLINAPVRQAVGMAVSSGYVWVDGMLFRYNQFDLSDRRYMEPRNFENSDARAVLLHELGHVVDMRLRHVSSGMVFENLYNRATDLGVMGFFEAKAIVHGYKPILNQGPDSPDEMFAEAFALYNMGYLPILRGFYPSLKTEQQEVIERIFSFVKE